MKQPDPDPSEKEVNPPTEDSAEQHSAELDRPPAGIEPQDQAPVIDDSKLSSNLGKFMIVGFWLLLMGLAYVWAARHLEFMYNPNNNTEIIVGNGEGGIELRINHHDQYITNGTINGEKVTFLVDTGATAISVPEGLAIRIGLERGIPVTLSTANGSVTGYYVLLDSVAVGELERRQVEAYINPGQDDDEVLLGMSYLRHFQLTQYRGTLSIKP